MSPFKKFWPREMFKFKNPLDYTVSEEPDRQTTNPYRANWANNLPSMQAKNPYIHNSQRRLEEKREQSAFDAAYRRTQEYSVPQVLAPYNIGQQNPYLQRNPYNANNAHLFEAFKQLNQLAENKQHQSQYEDPRQGIQGGQLRGLDQYGLLDGLSKDAIISEDEGWDLNDLPKPVNRYRDILPTMQYKPDPMPNPESDEVQF